MRSRLKISSVVLVIVMSLSVACETEKLLFQGPYFVRFTQTTMTEKESHSPVIKVEVHNGGPDPNGDVTVNYTVGGTAREGVDYVINGTRGKVKIKSGEYFGYVELKLINNANNILRSQDVILTLQTVESATEKRNIGQGVSQMGKVFTLTIQDDCILGGDYYGLSSPTAVPIPGITITSLDCEEYTLSNWDIDIFTFPSIRDLTFIDNGDNTLTIPPQEESTLDTDVATIDGTGVVNPATRVITLTIRLVDFDKKPTFTFNLNPN
ncbi:MAG TPA: hypothetical protein VFE50_17400 [Cyclobacteriaceae bacterium]|nr:hypothetical protein [Cyclobacteriaceae bacterium]